MEEVAIKDDAVVEEVATKKGKMREGNALSVFYPLFWFFKTIGLVTDNNKKGSSSIKMALCWLLSTICCGLLLVAYGLFVIISAKNNFAGIYLSGYILHGVSGVTLLLLTSYFTVGVLVALLILPYVVLTSVFFAMMIPLFIMQIVKGDWEQLCADLLTIGMLGALLSGIGLIVSSVLLYLIAKVGIPWLVLVLACAFGFTMGLPIGVSFVISVLGGAISLLLTIIKKERETFAPIFALIASAMAVVTAIALTSFAVLTVVNVVAAKGTMAGLLFAFVVFPYCAISMVLGLLSGADSLIQTIKGNNNVKGIVISVISISLPFLALVCTLITLFVSIVVGLIVK